MCSDAGPGAAGFSAAALNESIPGQTSQDTTRKFKSLAANTRALRPAGVRLRRPASKFADAEVSVSHLAGVGANHLAEVAAVFTILLRLVLTTRQCKSNKEKFRKPFSSPATAKNILAVNKKGTFP